MKKLIATFAICAALSWTGIASAVSVEFYGAWDPATEPNAPPTTEFPETPGNAVVSAMLNYSITGNKLEIIINNTSPITDSNGWKNAPALVGIGFDSGSTPLPTITDFTMNAYTIADPSTAVDISTKWTTSSGILQGTGGISFDYVPNTTKGVKGGLVNPLIVPPTGSDLYWTPATLSIKFSGDINDLTNWYVRFQNVGYGGEGSLSVPAVPEPATMLLFGTGLAGLAGFARRRAKKN